MTRLRIGAFQVEKNLLGRPPWSAPCRSKNQSVFKKQLAAKQKCVGKASVHQSQCVC